MGVEPEEEESKRTEKTNDEPFRHHPNIVPASSQHHHHHHHRYYESLPLSLYSSLLSAVFGVVVVVVVVDVDGDCCLRPKTDNRISDVNKRKGKASNTHETGWLKAATTPPPSFHRPSVFCPSVLLMRFDMPTVQPGVCVGISLDDDRYEMRYGLCWAIIILIIILMILLSSHFTLVTLLGCAVRGAKPSSVRKVKEKRRK